MSRSIQAQLTTAKLLLAQFIMQISEYDTHMEGTEEEKVEAIKAGRFDPTITDRIDGLRAGRTKWGRLVAELEAQAELANPEENR